MIRILLKGYLPISLLPPSKLNDILSEVEKALQATNPEYGIVIKWLYMYYDMKLVTFGIDGNRNLIVQFPVFVQLYMQQQLILYQIETVPVLIVNQNRQAQSYMHLQIDRTYVALISKMHISLRHRNC